MKLSEFYGKRIESADKKISGYVISVNAADGKIAGLVCADDNEREFKVDFKNILRVEGKIVFEDREGIIKKAKPLRLGRAGFSREGKYLGISEDYAFSGDKIASVKIGGRNYSAEKVTFGDVVIVERGKKVQN